MLLAAHDAILHRPDDILHRHNGMNFDRVAPFHLPQGGVRGMCPPLHSVHRDDHIRHRLTQSVQRFVQALAGGEGVLDQNDPVTGIRRFAHAAVCAVGHIEAVFLVQGHAGGDHHRDLLPGVAHQQVTVHIMFADALGVEHAQLGNLAGGLVVAGVDVVRRDAAALQRKGPELQHTVVCHEADETLLVVERVQPVAEQLVHGDAEVAGNHRQEEDIRQGLLVFPLADGLRRLCQLSLGDVLVLAKHLDLGADLLHPIAPFFALPSYPMAMILQTMETERLAQLLVEGGICGYGETTPECWGEEAWEWLYPPVLHIGICPMDDFLSHRSRCHIRCINAWIIKGIIKRKRHLHSSFYSCLIPAILNRSFDVLVF